MRAAFEAERRNTVSLIFYPRLISGNFCFRSGLDCSKLNQS
jgi:hypothetical protein